ncbi:MULTISPECIES: DUF1016 N-terminal domain-containing protein [Ruminococcus]|uniref:DUF1016 N-terminal domain-containing protein n=1 Tax=Ruminococcus TaxID=1263 RepID=UPI001FA7D451|nr:MULTISPECIES: DUF1016 N-terminal domain-containing protein [Ruminococcus]
MHKYLSDRLTAEFGKGFTERNLRAMRQFYSCFPNRHTLCAELSWSHYRILMKIVDKTVRDFYTEECTNLRIVASLVKYTALKNVLQS